MKRLAIYSFYDEKGVVDNYVIYQLKSFRPFFEKIYVTVNGQLQESSKEKLLSVADEILIRENKGFDAWAYKEAIEKIGYDKIKEYDELICFNHTCFGPVFSIYDMFSKMENQKCDFWGLYLITPPKGEIYNDEIYLPSYFVAYRKSLTENNAFSEFWSNLPPIENYNDAVKLYEQSQTSFFKDKGFIAKVAFDFSEYQKLSEWWFLEYQDKMLIEGKLPLLKRRPFFKEKGMVKGKFYKTVIPYLKNNTSYNVGLIFENLKRTQDILNLNKISKLKLLWWRFLAKFSIKKKEKYKNRLENIISKEELIEIFSNN